MASTITNVRELARILANRTGLDLLVETNSPGDGKTRYQLWTRDKDGRHHHQLFRALGAAEAVAMLNAQLALVDELTVETAP